MRDARRAPAAPAAPRAAVPTAPGKGAIAPAAPSLPPLVEVAHSPADEAPTLAEPIVEADDYVAVVEPLVEPAPAPEPEAESSPAAEVVAEGLSLRPPGRSVLVRSALVRDTPAPAEPVRPTFNFESLLVVRDALMALVDQAREQQRQAAATIVAEPVTVEPIAVEPVPATPPHNPLRVVVESPSDRLAMIPERADFGPSMSMAVEPELAPVPAEPPVLRYPPLALVEQLEALTMLKPASAWANEVLTRVDQLTREPRDVRPSWHGMIVELQSLAQQGFNDALAVADPGDQSAWLRASRALDRRLPVWTLLVEPEFTHHVFSDADRSDHPYGLMQVLHEIADLTADSEAGASWRAYLRLDDLAGLASIGSADQVDSRRSTAREVLMRMSDPWLTRDQQAYLAQPPLVNLGTELRPWASGETSLEGLAGLLERYESSGSRRDAAAVAELRLRLKYSSDPRLVLLADEVNRHYRNANMRVALSGEFLNRMIPEQAPKVAPVNSQIAGTGVRGRSQTKTELHLRLLPDPTVWRFGLEAYGKVRSQTYSDTWPVRVRNSSRMDYEARKLVMLNRFGLHVWPAEARAQGTTDLVGVDSSLRIVPIVGALVEGAAREQHRQNRSAAVAQVKKKITSEARERMDAEGDVKLRNMEERFRTNIMEPLNRFAIAAQPIDMSTTDDRATMRVRMAGEQQLAAHTPRPSAPSDSLASLQLHESALNNAMKGLELDGRRMTVGELHALLTSKIKRAAEAPPADLPERAKVEFAPHEAVRVACHNDRVELILNIVELRHGRDSIRNVKVHAFFRPEMEGMQVKLVRQGTLQFDGAHLRTGPRLVLHSVFGKLIRKEQEVPVLAARVADDPRMAGLMVTQLVIDDGWIALSVGPATPDRTAWRTRGVETR